MGFSAKQVQALRRNLDHRHVRTREANRRELFYIEGWYAITEANRIFGFDGWNRETLESKCVLARENRGTFLAIYVARVRITVHADGATIIREGHGTGEARGATPGEVHDIALKGAETDATKRALAWQRGRRAGRIEAKAVPHFQLHQPPHRHWPGLQRWSTSFGLVSSYGRDSPPDKSWSSFLPGYARNSTGVRHRGKMLLTIDGRYRTSKMHRYR